MTLTRCRTCLYPRTKPDLFFNPNGECSACTSFKKRPDVDWDGGKQELVNLLDRHDGRCIVPSSGGKDSHYIALTLLELGADVTIVTASTCQLTKIGRANINNLAKYARTIEVTPNRRVRAKLNRLGLQLVGDISWPEHASIFSIPLRMANLLKIPLVFYGENPQCEYGGPQGSDEAKIMTRRWVTEFGGFLGLRPSDFVGMEGITERDMADYQPPQETKAECHFLGQYIPWDSHENAVKARSAGMVWGIERPCESNWWYFENLDNAQTGIHDFFGYLKYGYSRACAQLSVDIRNKRISRKDALSWIDSHDHLFPQTYGEVPVMDVLERLNVGWKEFCAIATKFTNTTIHPNGHGLPFPC